MKEQKLRGVNLGGWLLMEGYLLGGRNIPEGEFKKRFRKIWGKRELEKFEQAFRDNFIRKEDFKIISSWGANIVRVPFHYRIIEKNSFSYDRKGIFWLDKVLVWADKYNLKVILDLHAAVGSQNRDWHSDSRGLALLWEKESYRDRTIALWELIASHFKDREALWGYDVINEPVIEKRKLNTLKKFYGKLINKIKRVDRNHFIILEGNLWGQDIEFLQDLIEPNVKVSIHFYQPLSFVFNFTPYYIYPGRIEAKVWNKSTVYKYLERYYKFSKKNKVEILVGEFGINWRNSFYGEKNYLRDVLDAFETFGFSYTLWTYKSVKNYTFPDGIFQLVPNLPFICREGPTSGWENYLTLWGKKKKKIIESWRTENYMLNYDLVKLLKEYFRRSKQ